jgi:hypothetical protein
MPVGVTEFEEIVFKDQVECLDEYFGVVVLETMLILAEVSAHAFQSWVCLNVRVHRRRITCKK